MPPRKSTNTKATVPPAAASTATAAAVSHSQDLTKQSSEVAVASTEADIASDLTSAGGTSGTGDILELAPESRALYEVLTPFKFRGFPVKPPAWIELSASGAKPYQDAGVLGTEPGELPSVDED